MSKKPSVNCFSRRRIITVIIISGCVSLMILLLFVVLMIIEPSLREGIISGSVYLFAVIILPLLHSLIELNCIISIRTQKWVRHTDGSKSRNSGMFTDSVFPNIGASIVLAIPLIVMIALDPPGKIVASAIAFCVYHILLAIDIVMLVKSGKSKIIENDNR